MMKIEDPFNYKDLKEIDLPDAPLVRVICQIRYSEIASIEEARFIGGFQESLREKYPLLRPEKSVFLDIHSHNEIHQREKIIWRLFDREEKWRITLASDFLALETVEYKNRNVFLSRFEETLISLAKYIKPSTFDRLGVRYIDQVKGDQFKQLNKLVRPEVVGIYSHSVAPKITGSIQQTLFKIEDVIKLSARWGILEKGHSYDPASLQAIDETSWILDLDVFKEVQMSDFSLDDVLKNARLLSDYAYSFFRWTVNDEFLKAYGGKI